ncbi:hypothetical protein SK128_019465 [Halocaridina rubra]|uniref:Condensation domain-containing protein n=1 Tax=Halocaridina rubra TaxID=373956 RepID=A0AAN8XEV0_HALRR
MASGSDKDWICEASDVEKVYEMTHKRGTFLLVYKLHLSSLEKICEDQVRSALTILARKCPNLRLCFGYKKETLWFRHRSSEDIDFQVLEGVDDDHVRDDLQTYRYDSLAGPLWCARLMINSEHDEYNLDTDFPFTAKFFLGIHHSITDGTTNIIICKGFVKILNDIISGNPIDEKSQMGSFISDVETDKIVALKMRELKKDTKLLHSIESSMSDMGLGMPTLLTVYPMPTGNQDKTGNLTHVLRETSTKKFIMKCKSEGVTLHSGLTALTLATKVKLLHGNRKVENSFRLIHGHVINLRRYWEGDASEALGCHAHMPLNMSTLVPNDVTSNFWEFTRHLHKDIQHHLKEETVLYRDAYMMMNNNKDATFEDMFKPKSSGQVDIVLSNLGDVTSIIGEGGPHVKPYLLVRHTSLNFTDIMNLGLFFHTFRGRLTFSLLYNSKFILKETAQKYFNEMFLLLEDLI